MKQSHTPGPWEYFDVGFGVGVKAHRGADIAHCRPEPRGFDTDRPDDEDRANARLIAAAPDMLDVLRAVAAHFADTDAPLGSAARALIAKVEGDE